MLKFLFIRVVFIQKLLFISKYHNKTEIIICGVFFINAISDKNHKSKYQQRKRFKET